MGKDDLVLLGGQSNVVDGFIQVEDEEVIQAARTLARTEVQTNKQIQSWHILVKC